jgi:hypothetical protein
MKETKEMMIKLPMVTAQTAQELNKARIYPQSGRYIVQLANGDIVIADIELRPIEQGEARTIAEDVQSYCTCFVGQPEILDPDEWVLAIDAKAAKMSYEADRKLMEEQMRKANERHEAEMAEQKEKCEAICRETEENCRKLIVEKEQELSANAEDCDKTLAMRRMELEQEYEKKKLQLELDTPKRFAQGEWVSGKTLTEIIRTLAAGKKED